MDPAAQFATVDEFLRDEEIGLTHVLSWTRSRKKRTAAQRAKNCRKRRHALMEKLGGKCLDCGENDFDLLEFDHVFDHDWDPVKTSRWRRIVIYEREAAQGKIELRCSFCNKAKGKPGWNRAGKRLLKK